MRDVTDRLGVTSEELTNWVRRGLLRDAPESTQGSERTFGPQHEKSLLEMCFAKELIATGISAAHAFEMASDWAVKCHSKQFARFACRARVSRAKRWEFIDYFPDSISVTGEDEIIDDRWTDDISDDYSRQPASLVIIDRHEIRDRVKLALRRCP